MLFFYKDVSIRLMPEEVTMPEELNEWSANLLLPCGTKNNFLKSLKKTV